MAGLALFLSCQKRYPARSNPHPDTASQPALLRSISWENGMHTIFEYKADSSLQLRKDISNSSNQSIHFICKEGRMIEHFNEIAITTNEYIYNAENQITKIIHRLKNNNPNRTEVEFGYLPSGHVDELHYFELYEDVKSLTGRSKYLYDANQDLYQIENFDHDGNLRLIYHIETYSPPCKLLPWVFIYPGINLNFALYNYPVLQKMNRFPAYIRQSAYDLNGTITSQFILEHILTLDSSTVKSLEIKTTYPGSPQNNSSISAEFSY